MTKKTTENIGGEAIKQIPYGISDYDLFLGANYYYIDKTQYISALEKAGRYLFFIRPRRFGKTLFLTIMEAYYDVYYKDRFDEFFQGTFIHKNPTPEKNSYLVLKLDFSQVNPNSDKVENSFLEYTRGQVEFFLKKYLEYLGKDGELLIKRIYEIETASDILSALSRLCRASHVKTYILIDEYDNFANTILTSTGKNAYHNLTHGEGFFRAFFNVLKGGTSGMEAPFTRLFLTGVSPITMDDVTSGYNIGDNISLMPGFNRMLGFTRQDVEEILSYYRSVDLLHHDVGHLLEIIDRWYANYLFSEYAPLQERLYNSDMVLFFLKEYFKIKAIPKDLIDRNVRIDYRKLRHLIIIDKKRTGTSKKGQESAKPTVNGNFSKLKEIIENGETLTSLADGFPLEEMKQSKNFKSLLFYLGLLTIKEPYRNQLRLEIPNETIRHLYYDYIESIYRETGIFSLDLEKYEELMSSMAYDGEWKSFFEFITLHMKESMSLRDFIEGERMVQAFLNVYLGLSKLYVIHPEYELNKGYCDLLLEPFLVSYEGINYSYLLELKYIQRTEKEPLDRKIKRLVKDAEAQLAQYSADKKLAKTLAKTTLIKLVLVFHGHEAVYIGQTKKL